MVRVTRQGSEIRQMFSAIASRYDFLNRVLSFGFDQRWRKRLASELNPQPGERILDLACGTADTALRLLNAYPALSQVVGTDFSWPMLARAKEKARRLQGRLALTLAQAEELPFRDGTFASVAVTFGIRNFWDRRAALKEIVRVLKPAGKLLLLEFSLPGPGPFRRVYMFYFLKILPRIAGLFSRRSAYTYLPYSVEDFPLPEQFAQSLKEAGFSRVTWSSLSRGIVTLYRAESA